MCTVTIHHAPNRLLVTMNRDEARDRGPEQPPSLFTDAALPWAAPIDGPTGGTWMGLNAHGVAACVLNGYMPGEPLTAHQPGAISRGRIIPRLMTLGSLDPIDAYLQNEFDPAPFASFILVVGAIGATIEYRWLGGAWKRTPLEPRPWHILTSSGWNSADVEAWRANRLQQWLDNGAPFHDHLPAFHAEFDRDKPEYSPLTERPWSATRSITQAEINGGASAVLRYWPVHDGQAAADPVELTLPA